MPSAARARFQAANCGRVGSGVAKAPRNRGAAHTCCGERRRLWARAASGEAILPCMCLALNELTAAKPFNTPKLPNALFSPSSSAVRTDRLRSAWLIGPAPAAEPGLVSVVIPTYEREAIIGRAIESVLAQTYQRLQIVVADDGSTDGTRAIVESYGDRVTYVRQENAGVSAARNLGLRHARGEFVALLDSDDEWHPWKLAAEVAAIARHPDAGIVWTDMEAVDETGQTTHPRYLRIMYGAYTKVDIERTLRVVDTAGALSAQVPETLRTAPVLQGDLFSEILLGNLLHTSTVLFRRSWVECTGGFDESSRSGEDYEFYIRLCSAGPAIFIDAPSTLYRVGAPDQLTRPSMLLEIARNNLRAVQRWIPDSMAHVSLPRRTLRRRLAESLAWLGEAELDAGLRWSAARRLATSLTVNPGLDRRALLLVRCSFAEKKWQWLRGVRRAISSFSMGRSAPELPA